jgi:hypothetical protein
MPEMIFVLVVVASQDCVFFGKKEADVHVGASMTSPGSRASRRLLPIHVVLTELFLNSTTPPKPQYH